MLKGKFGLSLPFIAAIAFAFCILRQPQSVLLVAGFALLAEKDEWLNRQVVQSIILILAYYVVDLVIGWIFSGLTTFFGWFDLYRVMEALIKANSFFNSFLYIILIGFSIFAIIQVLRRKEACLPIVAKLSQEGFPAPRPKPAPAPYQPASGQTPAAPAQPAAPATPAQPAAPAAPAQPAAPATPTQSAKTYVQPGTFAPSTPPAPAPTPAQPASPEPENVSEPVVKLCSVCSAPLEEGSVFCVSCGAKVE